jgi:hypothetical protein
MNPVVLLLALMLAACTGPGSSLSPTEADACAAGQARRDIGPYGREAPPPPACRLRLPLFSFR